MPPKPPIETSRLRPSDLLKIGQLAERTGLSISAIRFYEAKGLIFPSRNSGRHRRYLRSDIRRLSFLLIAQQLGFSIEDVRACMSSLPLSRTPTAKDWEKISRVMRADLDARIEALTRTRQNLDGCIGCGCLSLKKCALYNPQDRLSLQGAGPRLALGAD